MTDSKYIQENSNSMNKVVHLSLSIEPDNEDNKFTDRCGILSFRPQFLQKLRNIYLFLLTMCLVSILQTAISAGYLSSQITTLERRFSLDSFSIGVISSFFDVGFIVAAVFASFLGSQGRIPLWIGSGLIIMSLGAFISSIPEFISDYNFLPHKVLNQYLICNRNVNQTVECMDNIKSGLLIKLIFVVGQFVSGCGASPILSLGPTYIDDHVSPHIAPPLIALIYASNAMGPVVGYVVGAITLQYPVNNKLPPNAAPGDSDWIGAWWVGFLFFGCLALLLAFFLFLFPKRVRKIDSIKFGKIGNLSCFSKKKKETKNKTAKKRITLTQEENAEQAVNYGKNIKDIPKAVIQLITNKVFLFTSLAVCFELFLVNGFAAFLPKYIETEYKVSNIMASLISGGLIVPSGAFGIFIGGLIMHRWKLTRRRAVLFSLVGVFGVILCLALFFTVGCPRSKFAGIYQPITIDGVKYSQINNECTLSKCNYCDSSRYLPVCDVDSNTTYFSGCHAGCSSVKSLFKNEKIYDNCTCTTNPGTTLVTGECKLQCNNLWTFVVFVVVALLLTGVTQNPLLMVTIRSVKKHERAFALGFQFVIMRLVAYIPSPSVFGYVIDEACVHWNYGCNQERGDCVITDPVKLTKYLIGLCLLLKSCAFVMYFVLFFILPRNDAISKLRGINSVSLSNELNSAEKSEIRTNQESLLNDVKFANVDK